MCTPCRRSQPRHRVAHAERVPVRPRATAAVAAASSRRRHCQRPRRLQQLALGWQRHQRGQRQRSLALRRRCLRQRDPPRPWVRAIERFTPLSSKKRRRRRKPNRGRSRSKCHRSSATSSRSRSVAWTVFLSSQTKLRQRSREDAQRQQRPAGFAVGLCQLLERGVRARLDELANERATRFIDARRPSRKRPRLELIRLTIQTQPEAHGRVARRRIGAQPPRTSLLHPDMPPPLESVGPPTAPRP